MLTIRKKWPILAATLCLCIFPATADTTAKNKADAEKAQIEKAEIEAAQVHSHWEFLVAERKWKTDPALSVKVSFTAQREPLGEFLARLSKLGGTRFELPTDSPFKAKKLTATATEMPLLQVIQSLNRLYGMTWDELPAGGYSAVAIPLNEIEKEIWKFGDLMGWASPEQSMSGPKRKALAQALLQYLNAETIKTPAGQPLSSVPQELQKQVRDTIEYQSALSLIDAYSRALLPNIADSFLSAQRRPANPKPADGVDDKTTTATPTTVNLIDSRGKTVAPLGQFGVVPQVTVPKPEEPVKEPLAEPEKMGPY